jgi:hypothetical protein
VDPQLATAQSEADQQQKQAAAEVAQARKQSQLASNIEQIELARQQKQKLIEDSRQADIKAHAERQEVRPRDCVKCSRSFPSFFLSFFSFPASIILANIATLG